MKIISWTFQFNKRRVERFSILTEVQRIFKSLNIYCRIILKNFFIIISWFRNTCYFTWKSWLFNSLREYLWVIKISFLWWSLHKFEIIIIAQTFMSINIQNYSNRMYCNINQKEVWKYETCIWANRGS